MFILSCKKKDPSIVGSNNSGGSTVSDLDHPLKDKQTDTYNYKNDPKNPLVNRNSLIAYIWFLNLYSSFLELVKKKKVH
jgi:hypothetical protein